MLSTFMLIAIIIIFSCKKSFDDQPKEKHVISRTNPTEQKIVNFLNDQKNPLKTERVYSIDSAIWYTTAGLNFEYAIYDSSFAYFVKDTGYFSVGLDENNNVTQTELDEVYDRMVDSLEAFYESLPNSSAKHVIYCMVYEEEVFSGRLNAGMVAVIGVGFLGNFYGSFDEETDYWYAINSEGKCNGFEPAFYGIMDASDTIQSKLLHPLFVSDPDWRIYVIPESEVYLDRVEPFEYPYGGAPRGFRAYYYHADEPGWPGPQCLDPDELNFYIGGNGIPWIVEANRPEDLELVFIELEDDLYLGLDLYEEYHFLDITYGEKEKTTVPAGSL